jgi:hypothetical protein
MRVTYGALLVYLLIAAGCAYVHHLFTLRNALSRNFHEAGIGVSLTNGLNLTVTFVNGPWPDAPYDSQAAFALRVADYVSHNYQDFDSLQTVSIAFAHPGSAGPVTTTSTHPPFRFARTALQTGMVAADSANAVALCELDMGRPSADSP